MNEDTPYHLGHVHLKVRDLDRAVAFYRAVFDLTVNETQGRFAFLTWGDHHHDVALQAVGADAPTRAGASASTTPPSRWTPRALGDVYDRLAERDVPVTPVDHGISKALYFSDPAGNGLEAYVDTREEQEQSAWAGENRRFDPAVL